MREPLCLGLRLALDLAGCDRLNPVLARLVASGLLGAAGILGLLPMALGSPRQGRREPARRARELGAQRRMLALALLERPPLVLRRLFVLEGPAQRDRGAPDSGETLGVAPVVLHLFV